MTDFKIIILAIFEENNFPNKAMVEIHGKPMIEHVYETARTSSASEIVLATDSPRLGMIAEDFGATVCMVIDEEGNKDGSVGAALLAQIIDKMDWDEDTVVVNFPGDAPLTPGSILDQVANNLASQSVADCATLYSYINREIAEKQYAINMVVDKDDYVIYMSHCPIPHQASEEIQFSQYKCYIGINAYRAGFLRTFSELGSEELDKVEKIEHLKLLYNGMKIHAAEANSLIGQRVFTEKDVGRVTLQIAPTR
jgi:3-deoxy-manno-octulosonate cytidylyltransferase (CMP-KDO synthetase)